MAADVEAVSLVLDRPGQAAHLLRILLDDGHGHAALEQLVSGGQPGGAGTHDNDVFAFAFGDQIGHKYQRE